MKRALVALGIGVALCAATAGNALEPVATTAHFAFYSDFDTNLNDALLNAGVDRKFRRPELFQDGEEQACFEKLPGSMRTGWDLAVGFYREEISPGGFDDREQMLLRLDLSGLEEFEKERDQTFLEIARGFLSAAAPAYEACRWEIQDRENRAWIATILAQLKLHEAPIAKRLADLYQTPLAGLPIRVDVMETVNWAGATSIWLDPEGGHIQISKPEDGAVSLELVFHEASHTLMRPGAPIQKALAAAAEETGVELPRDLWHAMLFYTTGEAVREILQQAGEDYVPMMFANEGGIFSGHHAALRKAWVGYLDGSRTLEQAAGDLLRAVGEASSS